MAYHAEGHLLILHVDSAPWSVVDDNVKGAHVGAVGTDWILRGRWGRCFGCLVPLTGSGNIHIFTSKLFCVNRKQK